MKTLYLNNELVNTTAQTALELLNIGDIETALTREIKNIEDLGGVYRMSLFISAIDMLEAIVNDEDEPDLEDASLTFLLANRPVMFLVDLLNAIVVDDYILPDWNSFTDDHEYTDWTIELAEELTSK